ncbi:LamG-like jellyroll fold domain-containing protein [Longispora sp. K20-0274]|uniref:LamG-like jellyroll fold domain-containing protein n=1 Tax=Longispora sp. K20-0274 TaxID=3088255 RepID=UPI00399A5464
MIPLPAPRLRPAGTSTVFRRWGTASAAAVLLAGVVLVTAPAAVAAPVTCLDSQPTAPAAVAMAATCGRRVEVADARSESEQTFARPGGGYTTEQSAQPRWARRPDGGWAAIDTVLVARGDGTVGPAAAVLPISFSGGGAGPLARLRDGDKEIAVSWPGGPLPAPVLAGDTATYRDVLADVDLRVTASALGFSEVLVVKSAAAAANPALAEVSFGLATTGLSTAATGAGGLEARDASGRAVFTSPTPMMWDSADAPPAAAQAKVAGGRREARRAAMAVRVAGGRLSVVPDRAMMTDPQVSYPLFIDPSWTGHVKDNAWTTVWSKSGLQGASFWQDNSAANHADVLGGAPAGRTCDDSDSNGNCLSAQYVVRSLFRMDLSRVEGKKVTGASFRVRQKWAWTCGTRTNAKLWATGAISQDTTWTNQPAWDAAHTAQAPANHRVDSNFGCDGAGDVEFDATGLVQYALTTPGPDITLGLRAVDEGTVNQWKRFDATTPVLAIDYNSPPNIPDTLTVDNKACATGGGRPFVSTATPTLRGHFTDPDGDPMQTWLAAVRWNGTAFDESTAVSGSQTNVASGGTGAWTTSPLVDNGIYAYRAQSADYGKGGVSPVTAMPGNCEFQVDLVDPVVPTVTSAQYPENSVGCPADGCGAVGMVGTFTFTSSPDVVRYHWTLGPRSGDVTPAKMGGPGSLSWAPKDGEIAQKTLVVQAFDRAGRTSAKTYQFTVRNPQAAIGRWPLNDPAGTTTLPDTTDGHHDAVLAGGAPGMPGRIVGGDTAVRFDGTVGNYASVPHLVDTGQSYSVAAWVRLSDITAARTVLSQDGAHAAGFQLQYATGCACWQFAVPTADAANPALVKVTSGGATAELGVWTHLAGSYDAGTHTIALYVNGAKVQEAAAPAAPWNATGALTIGRGRWNDQPADPWSGDVADVRLWDRPISQFDATSAADPQLTGRVGEWHFGEVGDGPATDSSQYAHDLTFHPVATVPAEGSGKVGTGLRTDGTGWAGTDGPVLNTDQSFTVSAWARLDGTALPTANMTAVSQDGARQSAFYLGYRLWGTEAHWSFTCATGDVDASGFAHARGTAVLGTGDLNKWVHLVGVYDATAGQLRLYVNDVFQQATPCTTWNAHGGLAIARARYRGDLVDLWKGDIDEVRTFAGLVVPANVLTVDGQRTGPVTWAANSRCVDIPGGASAPLLTQLQSYTCNGTPAQEWTYDPVDHSVHALGRCLDVYNSGTTNGTVVDVYTCNQSYAQTWTYDPVTQALQAMGKCLDVANASTANGAKLQLYQCNATAAQKWSFAQ